MSSRSSTMTMLPPWRQVASSATCDGKISKQFEDQPGSGQHFWQVLDDLSGGGGADLRFRAGPAQVKFGAMSQLSSRQLGGRRFRYRYVGNDPSVRGMSGEDMFSDAQIGPSFQLQEDTLQEDAYLFPRLRLRTSEFDEALAELERQHDEGHAIVANLESALAAYEADPAGGFEAFAAAVERYTTTQWVHMNLESKVILPAAQKHLTAEDWSEIAEAFADNGDPRFSLENDDEFRQLFARILNLAPGPSPARPGGSADTTEMR